MYRVLDGVCFTRVSQLSNRIERVADVKTDSWNIHKAEKAIRGRESGIGRREPGGDTGGCGDRVLGIYGRGIFGISKLTRGKPGILCFPRGKSGVFPKICGIYRFPHQFFEITNFLIASWKPNGTNNQHHHPEGVRGFRVRVSRLELG